MRGLPTGAVLGHDDAWVEVSERVDAWLKNWLKNWSRQMESSDNGMNLINAGHLTSTLQRVHDAGMATAGQNDKPFLFDVQYYGLVIVNPWIGLPFAVDQRQLIGTAFFKRRCAWNLSCHQCSTADHHARSTLFDDFDVFGFKITPTRRKMFRLVPVRLDVLAFKIGVGMKHDWHSWPPVTFNESQ